MIYTGVNSAGDGLEYFDPVSDLRLTLTKPYLLNGLKIKTIETEFSPEQNTKLVFTLEENLEDFYGNFVERNIEKNNLFKFISI